MLLRLVPWILGVLMCGASVAGYVGKLQSKVPQKDDRSNERRTMRSTAFLAGAPRSSSVPGRQRTPAYGTHPIGTLE